jgi:hypothetical protein
MTHTFKKSDFKTITLTASNPAHYALRAYDVHATIDMSAELYETVFDVSSKCEDPFITVDVGKSVVEILIYSLEVKHHDEGVHVTLAGRLSRTVHPHTK